MVYKSLWIPSFEILFTGSHDLAIASTHPGFSSSRSLILNSLKAIGITPMMESFLQDGKEQS